MLSRDLLSTALWREQFHLEVVSKRLNRSLKGAPADEASSELQERFMDLGKSFVAHSKTMEIMEPSMSTFDYPSIFSEATAMLSAALRKNGFDTPIAQFRFCRNKDGWASKGDMISNAYLANE
jgi:hypothetical protein